MNKKEDGQENQKIRTHTGLVEVSKLINTRAPQSDLRISWIMFHKIAAMYRELNQQDNLQELLKIQKLKSPTPPYQGKCI